MINPIIKITAHDVTVSDPEGRAIAVPVSLTPVKRLLTQASVRALLSTGFMHHYAQFAAIDEHFVLAVIAHIRAHALRHHGGGGDR